MKARRDLAPGKHPVGTQYAALCYRLTDGGRPEVLLITSRDTGRWVIPKGWPIAGLDAAGSAAQEAWEEAGVRGAIDRHCLGLYSYGKVAADKSVLPTVVAVYPLAVDRMENKFPEKGMRKRKWFAPRKAAGKVAERELAELIAQFDPTVTATG